MADRRKKRAGASPSKRSSKRTARPAPKPRQRAKPRFLEVRGVFRAAVPSLDETRPLPNPIIVIPGNPASNLWDLYQTTPDAVYTLSRGGFPLHKPSAEKHYDRLAFHPDDPFVTLNTSGRAVSPARLAALSAFYLPYEDLVDRLRKDVGSEDLPAPVFPFAYDWRFDSSVGARSLEAFIDEVLRITSFLPGYKSAPPAEVDVVAHSFGGLVLSRYLRSCQQRTPRRTARVRKVVTIATPFRGAADALFAMIKDLDQRVLARALPSVWGLMPHYNNAAVDTTRNPGVPIDLLTDPTIWKSSSVERTLDAHCVAMGSNKTGAMRLAELRAQADLQRSDITALDVASALSSPDDWLPIVGIGCKTNVKIEVVSVQTPARPDAEFAFAQHDSGGDNTVPFLGAIPPFNLATGAPASLTPTERLVCFSDDDIGLHERGDWLGIGQTLGLVSLHSFLPKMDAVQQAIFGFLRQTPPRVKARARPAPGIDPGNVNWPESWNVVVGNEA